MEAALMTVLALVAMGLALAILWRVWPRSSRLGGYRVRPGGDHPDASTRSQERGEVAREDDDAPWHWPAEEEHPPRR